MFKLDVLLPIGVLLVVPMAFIHHAWEGNYAGCVMDVFAAKLALTVL